MFFTKYPHRANFSFAADYRPEQKALTIGNSTFDAEITSYADDVYHVRIGHSERWGENRSLEPLNLPSASDRHRLKASPGFLLQFLGRDGKPLLSSPATGGFGVCGEASLFEFEVGEGTRYYGMGEKTFGRMELSGLRSKFWNTDVWGDFHPGQWGNQPTDPPYYSCPYLIVRNGDEYIGLLLHNPYPTFFETPGNDESRVFVEWQRTSPNLILGSEGGEPNLWVIYGPTLREVTQKLQRLVGVTPTPPLWSLGYHQSRWGYGGHDDLMKLDAEFAKLQIPCDALWLDLDYMDGFRIFQTSEEMFPKGTQATADALAETDRRMVPILDPGVKSEPGYPVYDDGRKAGIFCQNPEGGEFIGLVWPGETVFPDFTMPEGRSWWAGYAKRFRESGFGGTWCDMNDPSTGPVDPNGMLFRRGTEPHAAHHNQYALGMQRATTDGFLAAVPNERPFILSRSGTTGTSRYAAIWTGDNLSNYFYLKTSIATSVNLALSGQPFNGADVGGFGGNCTEPLLLDWTKAAFLFPFMRNHADRTAAKQEPFAFSTAGMAVVRRYIRLRYKLLPYLYSLFVEQEATGEAILRPLFYDYDDPGLDAINDQFMVGQSILQAPFVEADAKSRMVTLPGTEPWYDAATGQWVAPGEHRVKAGRESTPLYIRAGSMIAMQPGTPVDNAKDLRNIHLHVFVPEGWSGEDSLTYHADDGISFDYRNGVRSSLNIRLVSVDGNLAIGTAMTADGFGPIGVTFVIHGPARSVRVNGASLAPTTAKVTLAGRPLSVSIFG